MYKCPLIKVYFYFYVSKTELFCVNSAFSQPLPLAQKRMQYCSCWSFKHVHLLIVFFNAIWPEIPKYNTMSFTDFRELFLNLIKQDNLLMQVLPITHEKSKMISKLQTRPFLEIETNPFDWRDGLPCANILYFYFSDSQGWAYIDKHNLLPAEKPAGSLHWIKMD